MTTCHRNLLVISLFLFSIFTTISSEINGRLFYLENDIEKPIIGATISLIGTTSGAISNTEGKFKIIINDKIKLNEIKLTINATGFKSKSVIWKNEFLNIKLEEKYFQSDGIVVSANKKNRSNSRCSYFNFHNLRTRIAIKTNELS